jgi:hypothetical protein
MDSEGIRLVYADDLELVADAICAGKPVDRRLALRAIKASNEGRLEHRGLSRLVIDANVRALDLDAWRRPNNIVRGPW